MYILMESEFTKLGTMTPTSPNIGSERDWVKIALVILVLALLGFNVFTYLSEITEWFRKTFGPLFSGTVGTVASVAGDTAKQTIKTAAKGTQEVVGEVSEGAESGITELQNVLGGKGMMRNNIDGRGIQSTLSQTESQFVIDQDLDDASTDFLGQKTKGHGNAGYCYIGEDRGVRSCMYVGNGDRCMSGMIYPTMDVCVNPNLRP